MLGRRQMWKRRGSRNICSDDHSSNNYVIMYGCDDDVEGELQHDDDDNYTSEGEKRSEIISAS